MNRPALLHLCAEHRNSLVVVLVFILSNRQLFFEFRGAVCDYLQVLLQEGLFLSRLFPGKEEIIPFLGHIFERGPELCDDGGQYVRVEGLSFERINVMGR